MIRKIIKIDQDKCNGCALCVQACHESAIVMQDGKAKLLRDDYCDGLGDCLPACPTGAISFEEREAAPYDHAAMLQNKAAQQSQPIPCGCPGMNVRSIRPAADTGDAPAPSAPHGSRLSQWPVQIKLVPVNAPYFQDANLLVAADCTAFAYGEFHNHFIRNRITLIGCPKLDDGDYSQKLTAILRNNTIKSLTIVRMEVPCCGGLEAAAKRALQDSGKFIPWQVVTITTDGAILD